ncbi:hypothetical protein PG993_013417 [Apiospora rasikravindrae]|uniref:DUF7708 domain-containing protein n=1 Tax=Apiospora rasikravindrae TaxID=990691 RepID=A0ABR1RXK3_9PEZI
MAKRGKQTHFQSLIGTQSKLNDCLTISRPHSVHEAYKEAFDAFSAELSKDKAKSEWISNTRHGNLEAVLASVADAKSQYESRKGDSKVLSLLVSVSEKIHHYSGIVDVFVSHHPEFTALAWGALKVLFVGVVNHQKVMHRLSEGLIQIADLLPRTELTLRLHPLPPLRQITTKIYGHVLRFLVRALGWYQESRFMHVVHSVTRPTELRYDDILASISSLSRDMSDMAIVSSHLEQRDMHIGIKNQIMGQENIHISLERLTEIVLEIQASMAAERILQEGARIEFRQQLSEVQLVQFLDHVKVAQMPEPINTFQASLFLSRKRCTRPSARGPAFWLEDKVQRWNQSNTSSLVAVHGTRKMKFHLQGFCVESIAMLRDKKTPVLWALKTIAPEGETTELVSSIDLIKYLISQAIAINKRIHTDAALAPSLKSYIGAKTEDDWLNILASVLHGIPYLYIILDVEVLSQSLAGPANGFWPAALFRIFAELSARGSKTVIRAALISYGSSLFKGLPTTKYSDCVVTVGRARQARSLPTSLARRCKNTPDALGGDTLDLTRLHFSSSSCSSRSRHSKRAHNKR